MSKQCFTWSQMAEEWDSANYIWSDVCILISAGGGGAAGFFEGSHKYIPPAEVAKDRLTKKEYKRFIEIVCNVNGISSKERKERKDKGEIEVTLSEITRTYEEIRRAVVLKKISREDI
jgi:hypothetical protein